MAKRGLKKAGKNSFKPGNKPKPPKVQIGGSRNHLAIEHRSLKAFLKEDLVMEITEALHRPYTETENICKLKDGSSIKCMVASIIKHTFENGDVVRLNALLDRTVGTVAQRLQISESEINNYINLSPEERRKKITELNDILHWQKQRELELQRIANGESVTIDVTPKPEPIKETEPGNS